jgi:hypothetical protein
MAELNACKLFACFQIVYVQRWWKCFHADYLASVLMQFSIHLMTIMPAATRVFSLQLYLRRGARLFQPPRRLSL